MTIAEKIFDNAIDNLITSKHLIFSKEFSGIVELVIKSRTLITGMGKCALVAEKMALTLACNNNDAIFLDPGHALHGNLGIMRFANLLIAFSNSGKTEEIVQIVRKIKEKNIKFVLITGSKDSVLGEMADVVLNYGKIEEACKLHLTPTTSFIVMATIADAIAMAVQEKIGITYEDYAFNHHHGYIGEISRQQLITKNNI